MSDLNLTITSEQQSDLEESLANIIGTSAINTYGAVATEFLSTILVTNQKPANFEQNIAAVEVYQNIVKNVFKTDQSAVDLEKMNIYRRLGDILKQFEAQIAEVKNSEPSNAENVEQSAPADTDVVDVTEEVPEEPKVSKKKVTRKSTKTQTIKNAPN